MAQQSNTTLVIDGDYLVYLASFVTQATSYIVTDSLQNIITSQKNKTKCSEYFSENNLDSSCFFIEKKVIVHNTWSDIAYNTVNSKIKKWMRLTDSKDYIIVLGRIF